MHFRTLNFNSLRCVATLAIALLVMASNANAEVVISYGSLEGGDRFIDLDPDRDNQAISFFVTGLDADGGADGLEFNIQVGDGGEALGGSDTGPIITSVDLITDTIWADSSPTQLDVEAHPLLRQSTVDVTSLVTADGQIGTIFFDTRNFEGGTFDFRLTVAAPGQDFPTVFYNGGDTLTTVAPNGFVRIAAVPEPGSALILASFGLFALRRRRRS